MDEEDVTLYIKCKNKENVEEIHNLIIKLLDDLKISYRSFGVFKSLEMQVNDYLIFARYIFSNNDLAFIHKRYIITDEEIKEKLYKYQNNREKYLFEFIFGSLLKGNL